MAFNLFGRFSLLFVLSTLGFLISFTNQIAISYNFGTSKELDSYLSLVSVAGIFLFYVSPLKDALIKAVFGAYANNKEAASEVYSSGLIFQSCLALVSIGLFIFSPISRLYHDTVKDVIEKSIIVSFVPYMLLLGLSEIANSLLLSLNKLIYQSIARLISSTVGLLIILGLASKFGIYALIIALQASQLINLIVSFYGLFNEGVKFRFVLPTIIFKTKGILSMFGALSFGYLLAQLYVFFDRFAMMRMSTGLLSSFQYGTTLVNVGISLIVHPIWNIIWPKFLNFELNEDWEGMIILGQKALSIVVLVLFFGCSFVFINASDIVTIIYYRGKFSANSIEMTAMALKATIFTAIPITIYGVLTRILMTIGEARKLAFASFIMALSGIFVISISFWGEYKSLIVFHWLLSNIVGALVVFQMVRNKFINFCSNLRHLFFSAIKALLIVIMSLYILHQLNDILNFKLILISLLIKGALYFFMVLILSYVFGLWSHLKLGSSANNFDK